MEKCHYCDGNLKEDTQIVTHKGNTYPIQAKKCSRDPEHIFYDLEEVDRVRKKVNPTLMEKLKGIFTGDEVKTIDLPGRIL